MAFIHDDVFDNLTAGKASINDLWICSTSALATYAAATTSKLGEKAAPTTTGPRNSTSGTGRAIATTAITDGTVTNNGSARGWAMISTTNSKLLASGALTATQVVTSGNTFTLDLVEVAIRDAS